MLSASTPGKLIEKKRPADFVGVGQWYEDFSQTKDEEVRDLLERANRLPNPIRA
jgi:predicted phosphoribosyltransferase